MKILVAIDNTDMLAMFGSMIVSSGFDAPLKVNTGRDARKVCKDREIEVIILDDKLPDVKPLELFAELKELRPKVSIIMLCSEPSEEEIVDMGKLGVSGVLLKPFNRGTVEKMINRCTAKPEDKKDETREERQHRVTTTLIKRYIKIHEQIVVEFEGSEEEYSSYFVKVGQNSALIEKIEDEEGHKLAIQGTPFRAKVFDQGCSVEFFSKINKDLVKGGKVVYSIPFPNNLIFVDRRKTTRVQMDFMSDIAVSFSFQGAGDDNSKIINLSQSGICIEVPKKNYEGKMSPGDSINLLNFSDGGERQFVFDLEVTRVSYNEETDSSIIAGSFKNPPKGMAKALDAYVKELVVQRKKFVAKNKKSTK